MIESLNNRKSKGNVKSVQCLAWKKIVINHNDDI